MQAKTIAVCMAKGGVGKSITAINLCAGLALSGKKVLLVDIDPQQGNATLSLGFLPNKLQFTATNILSSYLDLGQADGIDKAILPISENFHLLPSNPKLETVQNRLISEHTKIGLFEDEKTVASHNALKHILSEIQDRYDFIIIDCPPSVSMLTINAMVAADSVILPMEAHYESYEALRHILDVIARIRSNWNPALTVEGVLITKYQSRTKLCREVSKYTADNFGEIVHIFPNTIPLSIKAAELSSVGTSIFTHDPNSDVALAYGNLAKEVIENA